MKKEVEIKVLRQHWIKDDGKDDGKDDPQDLCSHGALYVRIGEEELSNRKSGSWTLSSTALYLMRTVTDDYKAGNYASQLIPCCGHFFMADDEGGTVEILGCPNGIDWTIEHISDNQIKHVSSKGTKGLIDKASYRQIVLEFVDQIERFYQESLPKVKPEDEFERKGYEAFWKEWGTLKQHLKRKN